MAIKFKNLEQFNVKLKKFEKLTEAQHTALLKKVAFQVLSGVVEKTPVDTGRARGNWQVAIGSAGSAVVDRVDQSGTAPASLPPGTSAAIDDGLAKLAGVPPFSKIVIFNNVEYIVALEYGHSKAQAPLGMVRLTIAEVEAQFS